MRRRHSSFTTTIGIAFSALFGSATIANAQWTALTNAPPAFLDTCVQLTNGQVMCHQYSSNAWHLLTPDINGSYVNGTWSATATMPNGTDTSTLNGGCAPCVYAPLYFLSSVMADGQVVVVGGEYNTNGQTWSDIGFMYDPVTDTWSSQLSVPWGAGTIGDAQGIVLDDGTLLLARSIGSTAVATFNQATLTFTATSPTGKADSNNEENWNILPDGTVLTVDARIQSQSEIYDPVTNNWTSQAMPVNLADTGTNTNSREIGPGVLRPDGTLIYFGSTSLGQNALYDTNNGTWSNTTAMDFPLVGGQTYSFAVADGPASLLPNGNVLVMASPVTNLNCNSNPAPCGVFNSPSNFFELDYATNTLSSVANTPNSASYTSYQGRMLLLPTGKVLLVAYNQNATQEVMVYSNGGAPQEAWRPVITGCVGEVVAGETYSLSGTLFNGLSEGATYGDDAAMSTNYPLVRIKNIGTGHIFYARTHDHSRMGVQTLGSTEIVSTLFDAPAGMEAGESELSVVVNGIASNPIIINGDNDGPSCQDNGPYSVECTGSRTSIQLNGSGASDPNDADILAYKWTTDCPGGSFDDDSLVSPVLTVDSGHPSCPLDCTATLTVTDCYGETAVCESNVNVYDDSNPTIVSDAVGGLVDDECEYVLPFTATITDNCCVDPIAVSVAVTNPTNNATLSNLSVANVSQDGGKRVEVTGSVLVSDLTSCPATIRIEVNATDCCGNSAVQSVATADVNDNIEPVITCPDPITLDRGDKLCNTDVQDWLDSTTATDNCDTDVAIVDDSAENGFECGFPYDSTTTVEWTATDDCGNTSNCSSTITINPAHRIETTKKGSLLMFSNVELKWDAAGNLIQDTVLEIANDYEDDVFVQFYFANGDDPREAIFAGNPPQMVAEGEPGWNNVDCQTLLTANQPLYMSMSSGSPLGCQPFGILDPGERPGRPDVEGPDGQRVLRGYVYAWAVDNAGEEIRWNHLSGSGTIVHYGDASAWEYNAYAAQTTCLAQGERPLDCIEFDANGTCCEATVIPGQMDLDTFQYDVAFDKLLMSFVPSGSDAVSGSLASVQVDTDLTLHPVDQDFRSNADYPFTTSAKFDIWNMSENRFSGTKRCITCWDQTLLSDYDAPNHFLLQTLQSDKGKARIDGVVDAQSCGRYQLSAALLGVTNKLLSFSGVALERAAGGHTLTGQGMQRATIRNDIIRPPGELIGIIGELDRQPIDLSLRSSTPTSKNATTRENGR